MIYHRYRPGFISVIRQALLYVSKIQESTVPINVIDNNGIDSNCYVFYNKKSFYSKNCGIFINKRLNDKNNQAYYKPDYFL
jgi:hypothetical protein